ncbi:cellular tumor antigen p53-like [Anopheles bellator]|uniref:cellular tumor antigen p53-like n=1 Tax=Anopheles bellator TaxID=139047 RepID=UPI002649217C|nr:cellular tumor antigen p53-like [Anopheles bellator]
MNLGNVEIFGNIDTSGMLSSSQSDGLGALVGLSTADFFQTDGMPTDDCNIFKWEPNSNFLPNMCPEDANCFDTKSSPNFLANTYYGDHVTKAPSLDEFNHEAYNLNVSMLGAAGEGSGSNCGPNYYYSTELQKLFVKKKHSFTVDVSYSNVSNERLFLRVMLLCSAPHEKHRTISRCPHDMSTDSVSQNVHEHVVRCQDPSPLYVGKTGGSAFQDRLAVIISLSGTGHGLSVPVSLEFHCQNSCPTIGRRATALVFTLENDRCDIYGRKTMNVKICSCPKRDKDKEEKNRTGTKRKNATESVVDEQPPRKLTRQSSVTSSRDKPTGTSQCNSPVPTSSTAAMTRIKKENEGSLSRTSSNLSTSSSFLENDAASVTLNLRLPNIAMAVDVAEYAFMKVAAYLVRCKNDVDEYTRYSNYLSHYRRVKSKYAQK